jgi:hypothetical protein
MVERPAPDPAALLEEWLQWEKGEVEPGRLIANLKKGGLKELLEEQASAKAGSTD